MLMNLNHFARLAWTRPRDFGTLPPRVSSLPIFVSVMLRRLTHFRSLRTASLIVAFGVFAASSTGCKSWNCWGLLEKEEGFPAEEQKLTENLRPSEPNSKSWSVSAKAKQIDRNFGIGRE